MKAQLEEPNLLARGVELNSETDEERTVLKEIWDTGGGAATFSREKDGSIKLVVCPHVNDLKVEIIKECPVCHNQVSREPAPYEIFNVITRFLEDRGWSIGVMPYTEPQDEPCLDSNRHEWEGRSIAGIPFKKCLKCNRVQRQLYKPYFEDFDLKNVETVWESGEPSSIENLPPYSLHAWE